MKLQNLGLYAYLKYTLAYIHLIYNSLEWCNWKGCIINIMGINIDTDRLKIFWGFTSPEMNRSQP